MTIALQGRKIAQQITEQFSDAVVDSDEATVIVNPKNLFQVAQFLQNTPGLDFDYLTNLTAVDYLDYFEVVYQLTSMMHNHSLVLKTRCHDRHNSVVPSVITVWRGADLQEREIYDLFGIGFEGHPNLKRIVLWEGFEGHPLRKDYL